MCVLWISNDILPSGLGPTIPKSPCYFNGKIKTLSVEGSDISGLPEVRLRLGHNRAVFMELAKSFQDECSLVACPPIEYNNLTEWSKCKGMRYPFSPFLSWKWT
jgi:hypothetical protein